MIKLMDKGRGYTFEYVSVGSLWDDGPPIRGIKPGGSIERVQTSEKESGTLSCSSIDELPDDGRIRIYANDLYTGDRYPLSTMRITRPSTKVTSASGETADIKMLSVLTYASQDGPTVPYVVNAGDNIIDAVKNIFENLGLKVNAVSSNTVLAESKVYDEDNWLSIANDLLTGSPNYSSAWPDRYGTVMLTPYIEPSEKAAFTVFSDSGEQRSKFIGSSSTDDDWYSVPNRVVLRYDGSESSYRAVAEDCSGSRLSYESRGYWVTYSESVSDVPETGIQAYLDARAQQMLRSKQSNVAANEYTGEFVPGLNLNDVVGFRWSKYDIDFIRSVYSMKYHLTGSLLVDYRIREYIRRE